MRSWADEWRATWLADDTFVFLLDGWARRQLTEHHARAGRAASVESVGPWSVGGLASDVGRFAATQNWLWASMDLCQLQELVFCAADGGLKASNNVPRWINITVDQLRLVRNALMHPAFSASNGGEPHVELLRPLLERDPDFAKLAKDLESDRSMMATRPLTVFTLRRVNSTVREYRRVIGV